MIERLNVELDKLDFIVSEKSKRFFELSSLQDEYLRCYIPNTKQAEQILERLTPLQEVNTSVVVMGSRSALDKMDSLSENIDSITIPTKLAGVGVILISKDCYLFVREGRKEATVLFGNDERCLDLINKIYKRLLALNTNEI